MSAGATPAVPTPDRLALAHARLLHDRSIQFAFDAVQPSPHAPEWLKTIGRFLLWAAPALKWVFWGLLAAGVLLVAWFLVRELWFYKRPEAGRRGTVLTSGLEAWRPTAELARALLADADRLAAEGRYAEAARVLLHRSVDDIEGRRPDLLGPSLTSRDIAAISALPDSARDAFGRIARVVERGLFAGRAVDQAGWAECRRAYKTFAFPDVWAAGSRAP